MMEGTLWAGVWDPTTMSFSFHRIDDFEPATAGRAVEMLYNARGRPPLRHHGEAGSFVNVYDNSDPRPRNFCRPFLPPTARTIPCSRRMSITCSCERPAQPGGRATPPVTVIDLQGGTV